jgi:hypothetical protein
MKKPLLPEPRWKRIIISLFLLFHLIVVPLGSALSVLRPNRTAIEDFMANYVFALRVRQYWALFSPEPRKHALKYWAQIVYRDGSVKTWIRPYPSNWSFFDRHLCYQFQKWDLVSNYLDYESGLWNSLVAYLQKTHKNELNPVVEIRFLRSFAPWPPPNPTGYVGGETSDLKWSDQILFTYDVRQGQFL